MSNSAYGKTVETLRKRNNGRLVKNAKGYLKYVRKPNLFFKKYSIKILLLFTKVNQF